jgi:hypothetical protein
MSNEDRVVPKIQSCSDNWQTFPVCAGKWDISMVPANVEALKIAKDELEKQLVKFQQKTAPAKAQDIKIIIGLLSAPEIQSLVKDSKELSKELPRQGYVIRVLGNTIVVAGKSRRGAFYGAMTLLQLTDSKGLTITDIKDFPVWESRYAGSYGPAPRRDYLKLARFKIGGFAMQWRMSEWKDFNPEANWGVRKVSESMAEVKKLSENDIMDFMLLINIYAAERTRKYPMFNCADKADVNALIEKCRYAAAQGVKHIMICADDWTPKAKGRYICSHESEKKKFGSIGTAHGSLMTELYLSLYKDFPELELSIVPPPYSLYNHYVSDPQISQYLVDFNKAAHPQVMLAWTGPGILSKNIKKKHYKEYSKYMPERKLILWDNSQCFDSTMPAWETKFYKGFAADSNGIIFLNAHTCGLFWTDPYIRTANDYTWNPRQYNMRRSFQATNTLLYSSKIADFIMAYRDKLLALIKASKYKNVALQEKLLPEVEAMLKKFPEYGLSSYRQNAAIKGVKELLYAKLSEVSVPIIASSNVDEKTIWDKAASFKLKRNDNGPKKIPEEYAATGKIAIANNAVYIRLEMKQPEMNKIKKPINKKHDDYIFANPEMVEIFIQPNKNGDYGHFAFDNFGNYFDEKSADGQDSWDPDWKVNIDKKKNMWIATMKVTLDEMELIGAEKPERGVTWRFNVLRIPYKSTIQAFSPTTNHGFHEKEMFGLVRFK